MTLTPGGRACRSPKARVPGKGFCPAGEGFYYAGGGLSRRRGFITPERPPLCEGAAPKGLLKAAAPGGQGRPFRRGGACPLGRAGQSRRGFFAGERGLCRGVRRPARGRRKACRLRRRGRCNFFGRAASQRGRRGQSSPALRRGPSGRRRFGPVRSPAGPCGPAAAAPGAAAPCRKTPGRGVGRAGVPPFAPPARCFSI